MTANKIFTLDIDVRMRDIDGRGHVNNAVYFTYFEHGRLRFYNTVLNKKKLSEISFIMARTGCNFVHPITLSDHPLLQLQVKSIGTKSVAFEYRLVSRPDTDFVYATAESVQVCFDYRKNTSMTISKELRARFAEYMKPETSEAD